MSKISDITGRQYGRLTALKRVESTEYPCGAKLSNWLVRCECGKELTINLSALTTGNTKSCGCLAKEVSGAKFRTHGKSNTRLYVVWKQMIKRCENPHDPVYKWYGAKGVIVCEEWRNNYEVFEKWAKENGYNELAPRGVYTIDRIDGSGNYEQANCRLITIQEQQHNKKPRSVKSGLSN